MGYNVTQRAHEFRIEVRPREVSVLTVLREVPAVYAAVMSLD